jgi:hypothetical protein
MSIIKQIEILTKQNQAIYQSLVFKVNDSSFQRHHITDDISDDIKLEILKAENEAFKNMAKLYKPAPQAPKEKIIQPSKLSKSVQITTVDDEEETYEEPMIKFDCICNMEDIKRAFFNGEYPTFCTLIKANKFKYINSKYKYSSDYDSKPDYVARNLVKGFVRNFDDYRKYFLISIRCTQISTIPTKYEYELKWIVNTNDPICDIIGSLYDDFTYKDVLKTEIDQFLIDFEKKLTDDSPTLIAESYIH